MNLSNLSRGQRFKLFNDRIRQLRCDRAEAVACGDGEAIAETCRQERRLRGRIAALPRAFDERSRLRIPIAAPPLPPERRIRWRPGR